MPPAWQGFMSRATAAARRFGLAAVVSECHRIVKLGKENARLLKTDPAFQLLWKSNPMKKFATSGAYAKVNRYTPWDFSKLVREPCSPVHRRQVSPPRTPPELANVAAATRKRPAAALRESNASSSGAAAVPPAAKKKRLSKKKRPSENAEEQTEAELALEEAEGAVQSAVAASTRLLADDADGSELLEVAAKTMEAEKKAALVCAKASAVLKKSAKTEGKHLQVRLAAARAELCKLRKVVVEGERIGKGKQLLQEKLLEMHEVEEALKNAEDENMGTVVDYVHEKLVGIVSAVQPSVKGAHPKIKADLEALLEEAKSAKETLHEVKGELDESREEGSSAGDASFSRAYKKAVWKLTKGHTSTSHRYGIEAIEAARKIVEQKRAKEEAAQRLKDEVGALATGLERQSEALQQHQAETKEAFRKQANDTKAGFDAILSRLDRA